LAKFFDREHVFLDTPGETKTEVIDTMVQLMAQRGLISEVEHIRDSILERENALSTSIGEGVALPHARIKNQSDPMLCFFRLRKPIDFGSPDNKPVNLLFLELTDRDDEGMQLNLIAQIARFVAVEENRRRLLQCDKDEDIHHILSFDDSA
jgi:mannitol/fructose-specific phosphotransferase system IIA component (Ntr-type)